MADTDIASLVRAVTALIVAITVLLNLYNQKRVNDLHNKIDTLQTSVDYESETKADNLTK